MLIDYERGMDMSHYDGPAFYRKRDKLKQRSPKDQIIDVKSEDIEVTVPPKESVEPKSKPKLKSKQPLKQSTTQETPEVHAFRNFTKSHVITYNRALSQQRYYERILKALAKPADSYYLLDTTDAALEPVKRPVHVDYLSVEHQNKTAEASMPTTSATTTTSKSVAPAPTSEIQAPVPAKEAPSPTKPTTQTDASVATESVSETRSMSTQTDVEKATTTRSEVQPTTKPEAVVPPVKTTPKVPVHPEEPKQVSKVAPTDLKNPAGVQTIAQRQAAKLAAQLQQHPLTTAKKTPPVQSPVPKQVLPKSKVHQLTAQTKQAPAATTAYQFPPLQLLPVADATKTPDMAQWAETQKETLDETLTAFHVAGKVVKYTIGPTVTQFEVALDRGVKVSKITNLNDDLRLALAAKDIRIEAPIPGRSTVGIEIPNLHSRPVLLSEVLTSDAFKQNPSPLAIALGVNLFGQPIIGDLAKMPHALIAGSTGSGKSVFINSLLTSLMYKATPEEVKLLLIDPKVVELAPYNGLPHLLAPVISDTREASAALAWTVDEMEKRYQRFAAAGVRNMEEFNQKAQAQNKTSLQMAYIVVIIDELADLMMSASNDVQDSIARITQKARAAGIHLVVATQRPSVDVVTGTIKNNIPTRIAFTVSSQIDSRTIIDTGGAERLLGKGDMLYLGNGQNHPTRLQGTFINNEIDKIVDFVKQQRPSVYQFKASDLLKKSIAKSQEDELMPEILNYLTDEKTISTSKLQRTFSIGYNRAATIIDDLEAHNYIGQSQGSKPRDVFFDSQDLEKINERK